MPSICTNCHVNARCVYDEITRQHECVCSKGWTGDGTDCQMEDCRVTQNCDPNADCVNDVIVGKFRCLCKNGYMGKIKLYSHHEKVVDKWITIFICLQLSKLCVLVKFLSLKYTHLY